MSYHISNVKINLVINLNIETKSHPEDIENSYFPEIVEDYILDNVSVKKGNIKLEKYEIQDVKMFYDKGEDEDYHIIIGLKDGSWVQETVFSVDLSYIPDDDLNAHIIDTFKESKKFKKYEKEYSFMYVNFD